MKTKYLVRLSESLALASSVLTEQYFSGGVFYIFDVAENEVHLSLRVALGKVTQGENFNKKARERAQRLAFKKGYYLSSKVERRRLDHFGSPWKRTEDLGGAVRYKDSLIGVFVSTGFDDLFDEVVAISIGKFAKLNVYKPDLTEKADFHQYMLAHAALCGML